MQFNINFLDKNKTYSGLVFQKEANLFKHRPSFFIQISGGKVARELGYKYKLSEIPSHSFMLVYEDFDWWVYESHFKTGVHREKLWVWAYNEVGSYIEVFEDELFLSGCKRYIGREYGTMDIAAFAVEFFKNKPSLIRELDHGLFCTEYVSLCQEKPMLDLFKKLKNYYELQPVHHLIAMRELLKRPSVKGEL